MTAQSKLEFVAPLPPGRPPVRAAIFDFDGTISTLRCGWEDLMEPVMLRALARDGAVSEELRREVRAYIFESTGIQTIHQMRWLAREVERRGGRPKDPWAYKADYNESLLVLIGERLRKLAEGVKTADDFLIKGSRALLGLLRDAGIALYAASGTDHPDVLREAGRLGVLEYFSEVSGAPPGVDSCSKEAVLRRLLVEKNLTGPELAVIGDGKVEIALGREAGALTIGVASDEDKREGVNPVKRQKLIGAGANVIVGDFTAGWQILGLLRGSR